jgi:hypothetical protein
MFSVTVGLVNDLQILRKVLKNTVMTLNSQIFIQDANEEHLPVPTLTRRSTLSFLTASLTRPV